MRTSRIFLLLVLGALSAPLGCKGASNDADDAGASNADVPGRRRATYPPPRDVAAAPSTAVKTASGLATLVLAKGTGSMRPKPLDVVRFRFVGWKSNGEMFGASSLDPGGPPVRSRVNDGGIPGLSEGLQLMVTGERRRLWIPAALASNEEPRPSLVVDVELLEIIPAPLPPEVPDDAAGPPKSAQKTPSGMYWRLVSSRDSLGAKADFDCVVTYNATIWTRTGRLAASSVPEGEPEKGIVSGLTPPLNEALQLMAVGDTIRIWFDENQGAPPGGPYVAEIELLSSRSLSN